MYLAEALHAEMKPELQNEEAMYRERSMNSTRWALRNMWKSLG